MKKHSLRLMCLTALAATLAVSTTGSVGYACFMRSSQPVQVWLDHIHVDITDQVAVKTYNCTFRNPNRRAVMGATCYMELEPGAQVDDMSVLVDGKEMKAEILGVEKAKKVFNDIVRNGGSPALLEYYGNQLIQTQVPRIAAGGTVTVKLTYTTVLKNNGGLVRLQMLNTNPKALMQPLKSASVTVNIKSTRPIKNVYSPTHEIKLSETKGWDVTAKWSQNNYLAKYPFVFYYQTAEEKVGASLIAHRELDEEGTFMLMLSPTLGQGTGKVTDSQILPKDVVFCVDTSGSMLEGNKMEQAKAALRYCIKALRPGDRFNIVDFSTSARRFHESELVEVSDETKQQALKYADGLHARGGTAVAEALDLSLEALGKGDRLKMIVFATDGVPTIGERDPKKILKAIAVKNTNDVRIFVFGEGYDVNTKLLDFLALDHRGEADYILPKEDIEQKISHFFDRVGAPIMTDLELSFEGLKVKDVYPKKISDVFRGEQVIVFGRYSGHGQKKLKITGTVNGAKRTFEYSLNFPEYSENDRNAFVTRLWAGRKVDSLLSTLRKMETPAKELVDEVTFLAKRYGIVTPYTSYLMAEDIAPQSGPAAAPIILKRLEALKAVSGDRGAFGASADAKARRRSVNEAKESSRSRRLSRKSGGFADFEHQADRAFEGRGRGKSSLSALRYIGSRTFYKRGKSWFESEYDPQKHKTLKTVKVGSDEYFDLIRHHSRIAKYLALGEVILKIKGTWYHVKSS